MSNLKKTWLQENKYPVAAFLLIMAVYLPVNYFGFVSMDDFELFERFLYNKDAIDFQTIFFRDSATRYYRPLLAIFSFIDAQVWGTSLAGYHLTNYVVHLFNTILVFFIAKKIFQSDENVIFFSSTAMILFGLHPVTCESVAWVSGRSDLFGTFFVLLATSFYFLNSRVRYIFVPLGVFLGMLCKENALAGVPLIIMMSLTFSILNKQPSSSMMKNVCKWGFIMVIPLGVYFLLRTNGLEHISYNHATIGVKNSLTQTVQGKFQLVGVWFSVLKIFPVIAFYLKKIVFPFPLNFAITSIHMSAYSIGFVAFCLVNIIFLIKKRIIFVFCSLMLIMSFLPALPVAYGQIAWVALAERYLYLSVALFAVLISMYGHFLLSKNQIRKKTLSILLVSLICVFTFGTATRVWVWKNSKTLWEDTMSKNPDSSPVLVKFAQTAESEKSIWAYKKALSLSSDFIYKDIALMALAAHKASMNNYESTIQYITKALQFKDSSENFLGAAQIVQSFKTDDVNEKAKYIRQALSYYQAGYNKKASHIILYKIGNLYRQLNQAELAKAAYKKLIIRYPDSEYTKYAKIILAK